MQDETYYDKPFITTDTITSGGTVYANMGGLYSVPVLLDTIVKEDAIELVYKRQYQVSNNWGMPNPEVYKEIYSRTDGTMRVEQGIDPIAQDFSYEF